MKEINWIILFLSCGAPILINILLLIDSYSIFKSEMPAIKKVRHIMIAGIFQTVIYTVEYIAYVCNFWELRTLGMLMESAVYIGNQFLIFAYADFVYSKYEKKPHSIKMNQILFLSPICILLIFAIVNIFIPIFFNITPGTFQYTETPWVTLVNSIAALYLLFSAILDIKDYKKNAGYNCLPISLFFLPSLFGVALENFCPQIPALPLCCSISIAILYMQVLKQIARVDNLSGLFNRSQLPIRIGNQLRKLPPQTILAGIMLNVSCFRYINGACGNTADEKAVEAVGDILKEIAKGKGLCFRYGRDEFIVVLTLSDDRQIGEEIKQIAHEIDEFNQKTTTDFYLSVSQSFVVCDREKDTALTFIEKMDAEMHCDKSLA